MQIAPTGPPGAGLPLVHRHATSQRARRRIILAAILEMTQIVHIIIIKLIVS